MRRKVIIGVLVLFGVWWLRRDHASHEPARVQAAVLSDGFAALFGTRVVEIDRDGAIEHEMKLGVDAEVRLVGTRGGTAVGWQDGKKLKLGILDSDGNTESVSTWGKKVTRLCDGAATNEYRFGVGWLESDGRVWFVHGPLGTLAGDAVAETSASAEAAKVTWCAIASAERNVTLFWREGDRLLMNFCTAKACSGLIVRVPIGKTDTLLGYGCVSDSCLFATRDDGGAVKLYRISNKGRGLVKPLEQAAAGTAVAIVGAGTRAFAIAYIAKDGLATVQRVTVDGAISNVAHFDHVDEAPPSIAWAGGKLLVVIAPNRIHTVDLPQ
jgi:hypothetical protein